MPKMVPAPGASEVQVDNDGELEGGRGTKRTTDTARDDDGKRPRVDRAEGD